MSEEVKMINRTAKQSWIIIPKKQSEKLQPERKEQL